MKKLVKTLESELEVHEQQIKIEGLPSNGGYKAIYNQKHGIIHVAKKTFRLMKNSTFESVVHSIAESMGMNVEGFGTSHKGSNVYGFINNTERSKIAGFDFREYIMISNSRSGLSGFQIGSASYLPRCQNQLGILFKNRNSSIKFKNTSGISLRIDDLLKMIEGYKSQSDTFYQKIETYQDIKIDSLIIEEIIKRLVFDESAGDLEDSKIRKMDSRTETKKIELINSIQTETAELGLNAFGLLNGVTHYTTHKITDKNAVFGGLGTKSLSMTNKAIALIDEL